MTTKDTKMSVLKFVMSSITATTLTVFLLSSCATLPKNVDRPASYTYSDTDDTLLGKAYSDKKAAHPGQSGLVTLSNGLDAFVARAVLAKTAQRCIDVQYYLFHSDVTGLLFIDQLIKAADRGVRVRLLVDDMDLEGRDMGVVLLDSHPGIEVRIFNPFSRKRSRIPQFVTRFGSVTRRMHNKSFTVDNQASILGGRNIGDEYFDADPDMAFSDLDVMIIGPAVEAVSASFDRYWNSDLAYPFSVLWDKRPTAEEAAQKQKEFGQFVAEQSDSAYMQALRESDLSNKLRQHQVRYDWGKAEVVADDPMKIKHAKTQRQYQLVPKLAPYFEQVRKELIIFSPYFVPGKAGVTLFGKLCEKGVRIRILTNSLSSTDVGSVHAGYAKYRKELLKSGVEIYEMNSKPGSVERKEKTNFYGSSKVSLHTKSFVFDRKTVFIGSLNLDPRSVYQNTEIGVVFSGSKIAEGMGQWFDDNIEQIAFRLELHKRKDGSEGILWHGLVDGEPKTFDVEPFTGFWRRFSIDLISLLPIESQL
jgi:cardiolipin synthase C